MKTKLATVLIANTKQKFLQRRISTFVALSVLKCPAKLTKSDSRAY